MKLVRIIIDPEQEEKILKAATRLGISPTRIVNLLVERLEMVDVEEVVNFQFKPMTHHEPTRDFVVMPPTKNYTRKTKWWHDP